MPPKKKGAGRGRGRGGRAAEDQPAVQGRGAEFAPPVQRPEPQRIAEQPERNVPHPTGRGRPSAEVYRPPPARGPGDGAPQEPGRRAPQEPGRRAPQEPGHGALQAPGRGPLQESGHRALQEPGRAAPQEPPQKVLQKPASTSARPMMPSSSSTPAREILEPMAGLSLKPIVSQSKMAQRPDRGRLGRSIDLMANYFVLGMKDIAIYHYDVDIIYLHSRRKQVEGSKEEESGGESLRKGQSVMKQGRTAKEDSEKKVSHLEHEQKRAPGKERCRTIIREMIQQKNLQKYTPVYDGQKNIYTTKPLPFTKKETYIVTLDEERRYVDFQVYIQPVEKSDGSSNIISVERLHRVINGQSTEIPYEVIMALDTVLCHRYPPFKQVQVGRSFFKLQQRPLPLGEGIEIWFGYNQSLHLTERGPAVVVNFAAKAFHTSGPVLDYISDILSVNVTTLKTLYPKDVKTINDALAKVKVEVTHSRHPRKYAVKGLTKLSAKDQLFDINGTKMSVADYFFHAYKKRLQFPHLPCLHMRTNNKTTFIPMEVCVVAPHQPKLGKLSPKITSEMIRKTAIPPVDRFAKIENEMQQFKSVSGETMNSFGLSLNYQFMELKGRILEPPQLRYLNSSSKPFPGKWQMSGLQFLKPVENCSWVLLSFVNPRFCDERDLNRCAGILCDTAHTLGMGMERVRDIRVFGPRDSVDDALRWAKQNDIKFAVVVLSPKDNYHTYDEVKFIGDIRLNLVTQCLKDEVVKKKFNAQVAVNVLLKINTKIGGVNQALLQRPLMFLKPVIIFGADAAHSPRGFACPSIASVVGSLDAHPYRYAVTCQVQPNPDETKFSQEIILGMKEMVKSILHRFRVNTRGKNPEKILFFRDGVSEGQFSTVLEAEVPLIREACKEELENGFVPPITFIVVQKRHQTRFRPKWPKDGVGKSGNIPPGTTVDTDVTHPVFFDFFICSQEGIQGTSKPAHYTVLLDENNMKSDDLQSMCYHLCYTYARCTRSISVPPPVMYADLACTRAKKYADLFLRDDSQSIASSGSGQLKLPEEAVRAINSTMADIGGTRMFYV